MNPPRHYRSIVALVAAAAAIAASSSFVVEAFVVPPRTVLHDAAATMPLSSSSSSSSSSSTNAPGSKETEVERLLRKARELRNEVRTNEDQLHATLLSRKNARDAHVDGIISRLFPNEDDAAAADDDDSNAPPSDDLCDRLRENRLAADVLVSVIERLHEIEVRAMGREHVEPSVRPVDDDDDDDDRRVSFVRVSTPEDDVERDRARGRIDALIRAATVLDGEFMREKEMECDGRITHSDIVHWGGGNIAGMLKDKAKDLGRAHDEQFQKRLESFYDAAKRKHKRDEFDRDSWRDGDVWSP